MTSLTVSNLNLISVHNMKGDIFMKTKSKALALILAVITVFTMSASASAYVMSERYMTVYYGKAVNL